VFFDTEVREIKADNLNIRSKVEVFNLSNPILSYKTKLDEENACVNFWNVLFWVKGFCVTEQSGIKFNEVTFVLFK